ncbi:hypothetical protein QW060_00535 [Myroides ceti]|uniref:Lipoprotein n=1 Tax=Paenimyroides ceti TaxID=395087 RepID=A0ABT8CM79_9FLAO|nr:hypothetical protein [Paenimyroides ceti]MDN3705619.1 hypothetical protein [Paenimyroides ceti]
MKNFKKFTLGVMGAVLLATGLWACSNEDSTGQAEQTQMLGRNTPIYKNGDEVTNYFLESIGVKSVEEYNLSNEKELLSFIQKQNIDLDEYNLSDIQMITVNGENDYIGLNLFSKFDKNKSLSLKIRKFDKNKFELNKAVIVKSSYLSNGRLKAVEYSNAIDKSQFKFIDVEKLTVFADEDQLGPKRPGESYLDCVERNWDNFGYDLIGKIAQATQPHLVAAAIAIVCVAEEKK